MKKTVLMLILAVIFSPNCSAFNLKKENSFQNPELKRKLELVEKETNTYYGNNASLEKRVSEAEIYVFGSGKSGDLNTRIEKLANSLGVSLSEPVFKDEKISVAAAERPETKKNNYKSEKNTAINREKSQDYVYYSPKTVHYELSFLNNMEKKLLGKIYENDALSSRLSRVERKIFAKEFDYESDLIRLERLKSVQKAAKNNTEYKVNKFAKYAIAGAQIGGIVLLILAMIL